MMSTHTTLPTSPSLTVLGHASSRSARGVQDSSRSGPSNRLVLRFWRNVAIDGEGMMVLYERQRLVAVLVRRSDRNEVAPGQ
jgi:hypothetical protein